MAAYWTRVCMRMKGKSPKDRYSITQYMLINFVGMTKYQANKFILSYLADLQLSRTRTR